jgi:transcriptional regulator with XRE-family HTH domain
MPRRKSDPLDAMVGAKVRVFRINRGISQTALAEQLGVTFQQVQKYEKGANRIGASRLSQIATALDISIAELFEPSREKKAADIDSPFKLLAEPGALRVLKAYVQTSNPAVRRAIVNLIEGIASREPSSRSAVARQSRGKGRAQGARA